MGTAYRDSSIWLSVPRFAENFNCWVGRVSQLPIDQYELIALLALSITTCVDGYFRMSIFYRPRVRPLADVAATDCRHNSMN